MEQLDAITGIAAGSTVNDIVDIAARPITVALDITALRDQKLPAMFTPKGYSVKILPAQNIA